MLLPTDYLEFGQDYIVSGLAGIASRPAQVAILAIDPGVTTVGILPSIPVAGFSIGGFQINLNYGTTFLLSALDTGSFAGSTIQVINSCKRVAVFTGGKCNSNGNSISCDGCDATFEQLIPTLYYAKSYLVPAVPDNNGHTIQIVAKYNNTDITLNGAPLVSLNAGEYYDYNYNGNSDYLIEANNPVGLTQSTLSFGCAGHPQQFGDPSILNIANSEEGVKEAYLGLYDDAFYQQYAKITCQSSTPPIININGIPMVPIGGYQSLTQGGKTYYTGYTKLPTRKSYKFTSSTPFQGYYYGMGNKESVATCFAAALVNRNTDFNFDPKFVCDPSEPFTFTAIGDSVSNIKWEFGDGNSAANNPSIYSFANPGIYKVKLLSFRSSPFCKADTIEKTVSVYKRPANVLPPDTMPCVGTFYKLTIPTISGTSYLWSDGGSSLDRTFLTSKNLKLTITDSNNCQTIDSINIQYQECNFQTLKLANVFTPNKDGKNDEWRIISEGYSSVKTVIYNRWGQLVYSYDALIDPQWNGTMHNKGFTKCPDGVYYYSIVAYNKFQNAERLVKGSIQLIGGN